MYKLGFYAPESHVEIVKAACFQAGAGRLGNYEQCSWQTKGIGQFKPLAGSHPFIGTQELVERVDEIRVEMVCADHLIKQVVKALKQAHPYEVPAYDVVKLCEY